MRNKALKILGKRLYLRRLTTYDATREYATWLNDPQVNKYLETRHSTIYELRKYIQKHNKDPNSILVGIFSKDNDLHIGNMKLEPINWKAKTATFGILIGNKDYWGHGFGTEATRLLTDWAFKVLALKETRLGVISLNLAAIKVYKKAGFKITGRRKESINHDGHLFDEVLMSKSR